MTQQYSKQVPSVVVLKQCALCSHAPVYLCIRARLETFSAMALQVIEVVSSPNAPILPEDRWFL